MTRIRSRNSSRIEDRRGQGGGGGGLGFPRLGGRGGGLGIPIGRRGGGGIIGLLIIAAIYFLPRLLGNDGPGGLTQTAEGVGGNPCESELEQILCGATDDVQDYWLAAYPDTFGGEFEETKTVFFSGATNTGCGPASSETGPFYCPADHRVYFDLNFLTQLQEQFGATGDLAAQYIVAHEYGHHVQNITGQNDRPANFTGSRNEWSVAVELQADCYAGVLARDAAGRTDRNGLPLIEEGEIQEGLDAAAAVGDDRIQMQTQGRTNPETYTHGTSEQRVEAFTIGYEGGDPARCETGLR